MVRSCLAVVALAFAAATPAVGPGATPPVDVSGKIAFASDRSGSFEVYVADAAGGDARRITTRGGYGPVWSPGGRWLAFVREPASGPDAGRSVVYVVADDGTGERRVAAGTDPAWSPDGTRLAITRSAEIVLVGADGTGERRLTRANRADVGTFAGLPAWSPDGSRIAYATLNGFFTVGVDGSGLRQLSSWGADLDSWARPAWSPSGDAIALVTSTCCAEGDAEQSERQDRAPQLEVHGLADGGVRRLAVDVDDVLSWSPDGTRLAYARATSARGFVRELYVARVDGSGTVRMTTGAVGESSTAPAWSPDGGWLAYVRTRFPARLWSSSADIAVVRADGTSGYALTRSFPTGGTNEAPAWAAAAGPAALAGPAWTATPVPFTRRTASALYGEIAASGSRAAVFSSESGLPLFWQPSARVPTRSRAADLECNDVYGLVRSRGHAAWFCAFAHGVVEPVTDVTLVLTDAATKRSATVSGSQVERAGHHPAVEAGPRVAADGPLVVFNPDRRGSVLYRVLTGGATPTLRRIAADVAVADVDGDRIVGWRGEGTAVVVAPDGRVLATVRLDRRTAAGLELDHGRLVAVVGGRIWVHDLATAAEHTWPTVDVGGAPPTLVGVEGDLGVYVAGVTVHVLRLSTGRDVTLDLPNQGPWIHADLTEAGLFCTYAAPYVRQPGRLVFVPLAALAAAA
ncbi:MAG TPA: hypothetical protein VLB86_04650 [Gaiellaceae bacterium]|nr:hypothetical protein [Gaiellaceae bacterium]